MRRVLILVALAGLVWVPRAFGQCSCELKLGPHTVECCEGVFKEIDLCSTLGTGCKSIVTEVPCLPCTPTWASTSCSCSSTEGPAARRESPIPAVDPGDCQASLARLEEWVRTHPFSRHRHELRAEARQ